MCKKKDWKLSIITFLRPVNLYTFRCFGQLSGCKKSIPNNKYNTKCHSTIYHQVTTVLQTSTKVELQYVDTLAKIN